MIIKNNGFQKRFPSLNSFSTDYEMYLKKDRDLKYKLGNPKFEKMNKKNVLIIGNSHGRDTFNALYLNKELFTNYQFSILDTQIEILKSCSYERWLEKGFVIIKDTDNNLIKTVNSLKKNKELIIRFSDGKAETKVTKVSKNK